MCNDKKMPQSQQLQNAITNTWGMLITTTEWPTGIQQVEQELQLEAIMKFKR
jgi:hypothetical protein